MKKCDDRLCGDEEDYNPDGKYLDEQEGDDGEDLPADDNDGDPAWLDEHKYDTDDAQAEGEDIPQHPSGPWWRITAVGKRPKDYMLRDLIFGSLFRVPGPARLHRRIRWFREAPPSWVLSQLAHLSKEDMSAAIPLLALMDEHHSFLDYFVDPDLSAEDEELNSVGVPTSRSLRACWPVGALVEWAGAGKAPKRKTCGHPWACPWCYARDVLKLYYRLRRGPLLQPRHGQYLVQVSFSLTPEMIGVDPEWREQEMRRPRFDSGTPWWAEGPVVNFQRVLRKEVMEQQRLLLSGSLRQFVADLGMRDGLLTHRVSPALTRDGQYSYRHEFVALGTVNLRTKQAMAEFRDSSGIDGSPIEFQTEEGIQKGISSQVLVAALPASHPQALRYFLFGTSTGYPLDRLPLITREDALQNRPCRWLLHGRLAYGQWLHDGLPGAFAVTPLFLFDPVQWRCYLARTAGLPLYRCFGNWRRSVKHPSRGGSHARTIGRVSKLQKLARCLWPEVQASAKTNARGRPAYGAALSAAFTTKGIALSRREVTELLRWLRRDRSSPSE
jgi:hypothetical protein